MTHVDAGLLDSAELYHVKASFTMEIFLELCECTLPRCQGMDKLSHLEGCNENWYGPWPLQPMQYCTKYYSKCNISINSKYFTIIDNIIMYIIIYIYYILYILYPIYIYYILYIYPKHIPSEFASIYSRIWWFPKKWHASVISVGISKIVYNNNSPW